ncbi:MAG: hypothetical protein PHR77_05080 [Kiritimatiellae bacterium]|nr:hypothetical protein [Kiritimatiellia bacterium]MDD5521984.1 hypothetical protein [Kiritimatiellia bacterium]
MHAERFRKPDVGVADRRRDPGIPQGGLQDSQADRGALYGAIRHEYQADIHGQIFPCSALRRQRD